MEPEICSDACPRKPLADILAEINRVTNEIEVKLGIESGSLGYPESVEKLIALGDKAESIYSKLNKIALALEKL